MLTCALFPQPKNDSSIYHPEGSINSLNAVWGDQTEQGGFWRTLEWQIEGVLLHISLSHILALRSMRKRCERRKRRDTNNEKHPVVVNKTRVCACVCLAFICRGWLFAWGQGLFTVLLPCRVSACEVSLGDRKCSYILARTRDAHSLYTFYYVRLSFLLVCLTNGLKNFHVVNAASHLAALLVTVWIGDLVDYITWGITCML